MKTKTGFTGLAAFLLSKLDLQKIKGSGDNGYPEDIHAPPPPPGNR